MGRRWTSEGYYVYLRPTHTNYGNIACDNKRSIRENEAESVIWYQLKHHLALIDGILRERLTTEDRQTNQSEQIQLELARLESSVQKKNTDAMLLFEQITLRQKSQEQYQKKQRQIAAEIQSITSEIAVLRKKKAQYIRQTEADLNCERLRGMVNQDGINREMVQNLVDSIEFDGDKTLTVIFKYTDVLLNYTKRWKA